ncbi:carboxylesterase/lipase family protein [Streptomyces sp. AF1B]|uniref:carboxylesterase/lipase family protein n=1 Tax=Streptomyces sp. AF1B TaxID=3399503 RepID=UPI003AADD521
MRTDRGTVRGQAEGVHETIAVFRGIPFAKPPFGALRFAAPEPAEVWHGIRPAFDFGPPPPQHDRMNPAVFTGPGADAAPDCLTVNVWSPDPGAARLPVMVWFHGGAYAFGQAGDPVYDGARLASRGVVVVTFNYRVGMEGFAEIAGAPSNRGLLDQVAALRWVRENIAAFGGDPSRVTVFGESAGAGSIAALLAMDAAAGLFTRAVAQSVPGSFFSAGLAADIASAVVGRLGLAATADELHVSDPYALVRAAARTAATMVRRAERWGVVAYAETLFSPVVDGVTLPCSPWDAVERGAARGVDLLLGHNRDEYRLFMAKRGEFDAVSAERAALAHRVFGADADSERAYGRAYPDAGTEQLYERVASDWLCRIPTVQLLDAQARAGGSAHAYELRWPTPVSGGLLGSCHGLDVPLVFGTLEAPLARQLLGERPPREAVELSVRMRSAWTAFAATGDPGWPAYGLDARRTQVYDSADAVLGDPVAESRALWEKRRFGVLDLI